MDPSTPSPSPADPLVPAQVAPEGTARPLPPAAPRKRHWLRWLLFLCGFFLVIVALPIVLFFLLLGQLSLESDVLVQEEYHSLSKRGRDKIAIILVEGTILDGEGYVKHAIDRAREDENVKAIVLRVDSPGGTVTGSDYIYHHLTKLRTETKKPIVVSMGGLAASGGYYVSMAVGDTQDTIFAEPTSWTGSIGVVIPHYNIAGLMERYEVEEDSIKSHRLKQMGSPTRKMTEEERLIFQQLVNDSFTRFKQIVQSGRPAFRKNPAALDAVATGQIFTTNQALQNGLVDREGFIEDAIDRALELAKLDKDTTRVVKYKRQLGLFDVFLTVQAPSQQPDLQALLDLTAPRAYYLCTWLPTVTGTQR